MSDYYRVLTNSEIDSFPSGRELDGYVSEHVYGTPAYRYSWDNFPTDVYSTPPGEDYSYINRRQPYRVPSYSTDDTAVEGLLRYVGSNFCLPAQSRITVEYMPGPYPKCRCVIVARTYAPNGDATPASFTFSGEGGNLAFAICRAALKMVMLSTQRTFYFVDS